MASPVSLSETNQLQIADEAFWSNHLLHTSGALMSGAERLHAQFPLPKPSIMASICASASASPTTRLPGRYVLLVTAMNSLAQRIYTYLRDKGVEDLDLTVMVYAPGKNASRDRVEELLLDMDRFRPDFVLCPYMISKVPACIYNKYLTLVYHPGPPGDGGPSSLDWLVIGDNGAEPDAKIALQNLQAGGGGLRSHWGGMVFQPTAEMDKGPVWAWDEYEMPEEPVTKAQLYQKQASLAAVRCFHHAIARVMWTVKSIGYIDRSQDWVDTISPLPEWAQLAVSTKKAFRGGPLHYRPLLAVKDREIDLSTWSASEIISFIQASDSQPGARLSNITPDSPTSLFVYGVQPGGSSADIPRRLYEFLEYKTFNEIPNGTAIAVRDGAVLFKTRTIGLSGSCRAVWITMGRVIKPLGQPLEPKIPFAEALVRAGHENLIEHLLEWPLDWTRRLWGQWQEIYVEEMKVDDAIAMFVYWEFYNGAFSTAQCKQLLHVLMWATDPARGNVKALFLMGGHYFCNGIALNVIEDEASLAIESGEPQEANLEAGYATWANINAMNDLVEFLIGDTHEERSDFLVGRQTLCERGIVTVASVRGNAAAGGVALAAACDHVVVSSRVTLNPAYRAMGLHGSEFHTWSYVERCGQKAAGSTLREMLPLSAKGAKAIGLVDAVYAWDPAARLDRPDTMHKELVTKLLERHEGGTVEADACAPWCASPDIAVKGSPGPTRSIADVMCASKLAYFADSRSDWLLPPLLHYRTEELSQMLLDCFHPFRSKRYHSRRRAFIRKVKCDKTPTRYMTHMNEGLDPEDTEGFDHVGPWLRGREWGYVGQPPPISLLTSAWTAIPMFIDWTYKFDKTLTPGQLKRKRLLAVKIAEEAYSLQADYSDVPRMTTSWSSSTLGDIIESPQTTAVEHFGPSPESSPPKLIWDLPPPSRAVVKSKEPESNQPTMYPCFFQDPATQSAS